MIIIIKLFIEIILIINKTHNLAICPDLLHLEQTI